MARPAILRGGMLIPTERADIDGITAALTIEYCPMGEEPQEIEAFSFLAGGYIRVPRQYGLTYCAKNAIDFKDETSEGYEIAWPKIAAPRDYQIDFIDDLFAAQDEYYDFLARAHTGFGKTVAALIAAARRGVTTLVIVDQNNLRDQWVEALIKLFGFKPEQIGEIQGKVLKIEGCPVTIAMVQTLSRRKLPTWVYRYFGHVIVDEVHAIGTECYSRVLFQFPAMYRTGISATPKRKDGFQKLLDYHLGRVRVAADKEHEESAVYFAQHDTVYSWYANTAPKIGRFISEIAEDGSRNLLVANSAVWLYETGRDVLVLGDRIEHLKHLMSLCASMGIPEEEMGLYAGYNPVYGFTKELKPKSRPQHWQRGTEYTPVNLQLISKRISKKTLEHIKSHCGMIFATYGMFAKGVDIPRMAAGVDATPRAEIEQIHGRILRELMGKRKPIWITVVDWNSYRSLFGFANRAKGYVKSNARLFEWTESGGIEEWPVKELVTVVNQRVKELRSKQIVTNKDGHNMLLAANTVSPKKKERDQAIVAAFHSPQLDLPMDYSQSEHSVKSSTPISTIPQSLRVSRSRKQQPR